MLSRSWPPRSWCTSLRAKTRIPRRRPFFVSESALDDGNRPGVGVMPGGAS
jgi:hypothetical protein